jgi:hypothetical protein
LIEAVDGLKSQARYVFNKYAIPRDVQSHIICQALEQEGVIVYTPNMSAAHKRLYRHSSADKVLAEIVAFLKNHT